MSPARIGSACKTSKPDQSLLCSQWVVKTVKFVHSYSEGSDQAGWMLGTQVISYRADFKAYLSKVVGSVILAYKSPSRA